MNHPAPPSALRRELPEALLAELKAVFVDRLSTSMAMLEHHGRDESSYDPMLPDAEALGEYMIYVHVHE